MNTLTLNAWGSNHEITLNLDHYANNGNLYVGLVCWDEGFPEPWSNLTVNLSKKCKPNCGFIDINNNGEQIIDWLENNNLGMCTGNFEISGYCIYPEFEFDMNAVNKYVRRN